MKFTEFENVYWWNNVMGSIFLGRISAKYFRQGMYVIVQ